MKEKLENHVPVMVEELIRHLYIKENGIYVDCTLGRGGHAQALLKKHPQIKVIAFDQDQEAIERCRNNPFFASKAITFINDNFSNFSQYLNKLNIFQVDGFFFDLGVSSEQLADESRGFSYRQDSPLDMRMNKKSKLTAQEVINKYKYQELVDIFFNYGEEPKARKMARRICQQREKEEIITTKQLVRIAAGCFLEKGNRHPARRIFQALRIEVNQELTNLSQALDLAIQYLNVGGKVIAISYHSLEDRIVKQIFKKYNDKERFQAITKKPLIPSPEEIIDNNRARSAKMRVITRLS